MPSRRNKPGKFGTVTTSEFLCRAEEKVLDGAKRRDLEHPGAVYWASTTELHMACERLVARGDMLNTHAHGAFRLSPRLRTR